MASIYENLLKKEKNNTSDNVQEKDNDWAGTVHTHLIKFNKSYVLRLIQTVRFFLNATAFFYMRFCEIVYTV